MKRNKPILVDTKTACKLLSIKRTLLFQCLRDGTLVRCKAGGKTLIPMGSFRQVIWYQQKICQRCSRLRQRKSRSATASVSAGWHARVFPG